jgi:hypothetical protein
VPPVKLAENIKVMLDVLLEVAGEREFTAEMAEQFWGGTKAGKIKDLTTTQLLQYALTTTWLERDEVASAYDKLVEQIKSQTQQPNRAARRKMSKGGVVLP